jgi:cytoskeletal protein CcmA (bactofilin family)
MFGKKKQPPVRSLIDRGTQIRGNLTFTDGMRVDGNVVGNIHANEESASLIVIGESAVIEGDVYSDHVIINGKIVGNVHAFELLELQPKAQIEGDVSYKALEMHQGAVISGQLKPMIAGEKPTLKLAANNG